MLAITLPPFKKYPPAGICIYCESSSGTRTLEHIIPSGLEGRLKLPDASCTACQEITRDFEQAVLRGQFREPRTQLTMGRRRKHERLKALRIGRHEPSASAPPNLSNAGFRWENLPLAKHPWAILLPIFEPPDGGTPRNEIKLCGIQTHLPQNFNELMAQIGPGTMNLQPFEPESFCKMLAKIAHAAAFAEIGRARFKAFLPDFILGRIGGMQFIGSGGPANSTSEYWNEVRLFERDGLLLAGIRIFARYTTAVYEVMVGELA